MDREARMKRSNRGKPLSDRARRCALDRWRASGLSQEEFCRREGIHPATFSGWKRLFALSLKTSVGRVDSCATLPANSAQAVDAARTAPFVEARVVRSRAEAPSSRLARVAGTDSGPSGAVEQRGPGRQPSGGSGVAVVVGSHRVEVTQDFDVRTLRQVIAALGTDTA